MEEDWHYWKSQFIRELGGATADVLLERWPRASLEEMMIPFGGSGSGGGGEGEEEGDGGGGERREDGHVEPSCVQQVVLEYPVLASCAALRPLVIRGGFYISTFWPRKRLPRPKASFKGARRCPSPRLVPPLMPACRAGWGASKQSSPACSVAMNFDPAILETWRCELPQPQFPRYHPNAANPQHLSAIEPKRVRLLDRPLLTRRFRATSALIPLVRKPKRRPTFPSLRAINGHLERLPVVGCDRRVHQLCRSHRRAAWSPEFPRQVPTPRFPLSTPIRGEPLLMQDDTSPDMKQDEQPLLDPVIPLGKPSIAPPRNLSGTVMLNRTALRNLELTRILDAQEGLCVIERDFGNGLEVIAFSPHDCVCLLGPRQWLDLNEPEARRALVQLSRLFERIFLMVTADGPVRYESPLTALTSPHPSSLCAVPSRRGEYSESAR